MSFDKQTFCSFRYHNHQHQLYQPLYLSFAVLASLAFLPVIVRLVLDQLGYVLIAVVAWALEDAESPSRAPACQQSFSPSQQHLFCPVRLATSAGRSRKVACTSKGFCAVFLVALIWSPFSPFVRCMAACSLDLLCMWCAKLCFCQSGLYL